MHVYLTHTALTLVCLNRVVFYYCVTINNCFLYSLQIVEFQRQVDGLFFGTGFHLSSTAMFEYPNSTAMAQLINTELFSNNTNSNSNNAVASQQSNGTLSISVHNNQHTTTATTNATKDNTENDAGNDSSDDESGPVQNSIRNDSVKNDSIRNDSARDYSAAQHLAPLALTPQPQRRRSSVQCEQGSPAPLLSVMSPASSSNGGMSNGSGMSPVVTPSSETVVGNGRKMSVVVAAAAPGGALPYTQAEVTTVIDIYITCIVACFSSMHGQSCMSAQSQLIEECFGLYIVLMAAVMVYSA
jgi:hypothetical protein